jgi:phosphoglucosamine mutase
VYLKEFVRNAGADFAIAHDGDADRCIVIDNCGEMVPFDVQLAIMIEHEIKKNNSKNKKNNERNNKKIIATVEASLTIRDIVERTGGELEITPVGSTFVADALEERGALFGGEPCGEYIYQDSVHVPDAILGAAKLVEIFCKNGQFSKLKTQYPQNFMVREKFPANDKYDAIERIKSTIKTMKIDGEKIDGKIRDDDGIRVDEKDGWFLIRASGTEPIIRLTMEYKTKEKLETKKSELVELITLCNKGTK